MRKPNIDSLTNAPVARTKRLHSVLTVESFGEEWEREILNWCLDKSIENFSSECQYDLETTFEKIKMIGPSAFNEQS